ncbi:cyclic beta 1-2 glucan synthase [Klebsiella grimontii]|uniref:Cyclic beta 1-2 glucan synthase n=1 Tax=Klebsiella grimontii TaxID=2058152 RepID=A0A7H4NWZ4_9ENTR|nr:cyclic beta 1-2 glucan synthase [Klebsiella grimontii]
MLNCDGLTLIHRGRKPRSLELTTYAEVVLAPDASDLAHPAFSNLFIQTELLLSVTLFFATGARAHRMNRALAVSHDGGARR